MRWSVIVLVVSTLLTAAFASQPARELDMRERVRVQRILDLDYRAHQSGGVVPNLSTDEAILVS